MSRLPFSASVARRSCSCFTPLLLAALLLPGCRETRESASLALDMSACFLVEDGFRGGGANAGSQAGRNAQEDATHFGGEGICRSALELYAPETMTVCLTVRVGDEESGQAVNDSTCTFGWDTESREMTSGSCESNKGLPELTVGGQRVGMKPFFMASDVNTCPTSDLLNVTTSCSDFAGCLFSLPTVEETVVGTGEFTLAYGYKDGLTQCEVECGGAEVALPDGGGSIPVCWDPGTPSKELCDNIDNDCDGYVDEDFSVHGEGDDTVRGTAAYQAGGEAVPLASECDGVGACGVGEVVCRHDQAAACCSTDLGCAAEDDRGAASDETCNGEDDDCDGQVDEDYSIIEGSPGALVYTGQRLEGGSPQNIALEDTCDGVGICGVGRVVCRHDQAAACCNTDNDCAEAMETDPAGVPERADECDGQDNDCDGAIDEGLIFADANAADRELGQTCEAIGECNQGLVICGPAGSAAAGQACCSTDTDCGGALPGQELCDGLDNNCNGEVDEGFEGLGDSCRNEEAVCVDSGIITCSANALGTCCTRFNAIDEDPDNPSAECVSPDYQGPTFEVCTAGEGEEPDVCVTHPAPRIWGEEACDTQDNDCDGTADEGFETGTACSGTYGLCAEATGSLQCTGAQDATFCSVDPLGSEDAQQQETCDGVFGPDGNYQGLDEDCNGVADPDERESDEPSSPFLYTYEEDGISIRLGFPCQGEGICPAGIVECGDDGQSARCSTLPGGSDSPETQEVCDGLDNDCDGSIDETWPTLGTNCDGANGICAVGASGTFQCNAEGTDIVCSVDPGGTESPALEAELCNGQIDTCAADLPDNEVDTDDDGFLACQEAAAFCCGPGSGCDDADPDDLRTVNPDAPEICDGIDNNCDGIVPLDEVDDDLDGFVDCQPVVGANIQGGDCDDADPNSDPDETEVCDAAVSRKAGQILFNRGVRRVLAIAQGVTETGLVEPGADENCDDAREETWPTLGETCGLGICAHGYFECTADGTAVRCSTSTAQEGSESLQQAVELCNGLDDDCDGVVPEREQDLDGDGYFECDDQVPGVLGGDCIPDAPGSSNSYPGAPEVCDNLDNDCDCPDDAGCDADDPDATEFDFDEDPLNCGGCPVDDPASVQEDESITRNCPLDFQGKNVSVPGCDAGTCTIVQCSGGFYDLDGQTFNGCEYENPGGDVQNSDLPDALGTDNTDQNSDGFDGDISLSVFVAADGDDGAGCGSMGSPCLTLANGYAVAAARPELAVAVILAAGDYTLTEPLVMASGVSIHGGYCRLDGCTSQSTLEGNQLVRIWSRSDDATTITLQASARGAGYQGLAVPVVAKNLSRQTFVDRLQITSVDGATDANDTARHSSAVILVDNSSLNLVVRDTTLVAGQGADGTNGVAGAAGTAGQAAANGSDGNNGVESDQSNVACDQDAAPSAGAGGQAPAGSCGIGTQSHGQSGGAVQSGVLQVGLCNEIDGNYTECLSNNGVSGLNGYDAPDANVFGTGGGGSGGAGGAGAAGTADAGNPGQDGDDGRSGNAGAGGAGRGGSSSAGGILFAGTADGADGEDGQCGGGGGGAGGGTGGVNETNTVTFPGCGSFGGAGGGGGAGGAGGSAGAATGTGGGASAGIVLVNSGVLIAGTVTVNAAQGGDGGACGAGGAGANGGNGGQGGNGLNPATDGIASGAGGEGGDGGAGGNGGAAGGGGGGPSVAILRVYGTDSPSIDGNLIFNGGNGGGGGACADATAAGGDGYEGRCADPNDNGFACN